MDRVLTAEEAAALLRVKPRTLYEWLRKGKIRGRKVGRSWRIPEEPLLHWLNGDTAASSSSPRSAAASQNTGTGAQPASSQAPTFDPTARPIWEVFDEIMREVPEDELNRLPADGAEQHDHYVYGLPKRES
jgi:excisionase family DNA binding protein